MTARVSPARPRGQTHSIVSSPYRGWTNDIRCPVCGGSNTTTPDTGRTCSGLLLDETRAVCTDPAYRGRLPDRADTGHVQHELGETCPCEVRHEAPWNRGPHTNATRRRAPANPANLGSRDRIDLVTWVIREMAPCFTGPRLAVLIFILDRTVGFGKLCTWIPLRHFEDGVVKKDGIRVRVGLPHRRPEIHRAVHDLADRHAIIRRRDRRWGTFWYQINFPANVVVDLLERYRDLESLLDLETLNRMALRDQAAPYETRHAEADAADSGCPPAWVPGPPQRRRRRVCPLDRPLGEQSRGEIQAAYDDYKTWRERCSPPMLDADVLEYLHVLRLPQLPPEWAPFYDFSGLPADFEATLSRDLAQARSLAREAGRERDAAILAWRVFERNSQYRGHSGIVEGRGEPPLTP